MRQTIWASLFALGAALLSTEARAAGDWGLHTGDTLRRSDLMPYGELGWPDISAGLQYGVTERIDIGGRISLLYGWEHTTETNLGLGVRAPVRVSITKRSRFSAMAHIDPGFAFYGNGYYRYFPFEPESPRKKAVFGVQFPLGAEFGIHITPDATIQIGADLPMTIFFADKTTFVLAPMTGFGFEYHLDEHFGLGLNTRFGPVIFVRDSAAAAFGFLTQLEVMYRL